MRFLLGILSSRLVVAVAVVVSIMVTGDWLWEIRPFRSAEVKKPDAVVWSQSERDCLRTLIFDDATTLKQMRFMAHAALNLSDQPGQLEKSICKIHEEKNTLSAPSEDGTKSHRYAGAVDLWPVLPIIGNPGWFAKAGIEADRILKDRQADYNVEPCLASILRYIRPGKLGTFQDEKKMKKEMELLYDDGQGARFYGPKGSRNKCT